MLGDRVFQECYFITSITLINGLTVIGGGMFQETFSLPKITIPSTVTSIGYYNINLSRL
jgi:hypothetical protein